MHSTGGNADLTNPYASDATPSEASASPKSVGPAPDSGTAVRYSDIPTRCPGCGRGFNLRFFPRRYQKKTYLFFVGSVIASVLVASLVPIPILNTVVVVIVLGFLCNVGMNFHKVVRMRCDRCGWSHTYLVPVRGQTKRVPPAGVTKNSPVNPLPQRSPDG